MHRIWRYWRQIRRRSWNFSTFMENMLHMLQNIFYCFSTSLTLHYKITFNSILLTKNKFNLISPCPCYAKHGCEVITRIFGFFNCPLPINLLPVSRNGDKPLLGPDFHYIQLVTKVWHPLPAKIINVLNTKKFHVLVHFYQILLTKPLFGCMVSCISN